MRVLVVVGSCLCRVITHVDCCWGFGLTRKGIETNLAEQQSAAVMGKRSADAQAESNEPLKDS